MRPGVTGWAQVRYGYANNLEEETEKMRYDLFYIKNRSLWLDARILLRDGRHHASSARAPAKSRRPSPQRACDAASARSPTSAVATEDVRALPLARRVDRSARPTVGRPAARQQAVDVTTATRDRGGGRCSTRRPPQRRPRRAAHAAPAAASRSGALVAFTAILLLSPQTWFPVLKVLRIAFLAAGIAIGGARHRSHRHAGSRSRRSRPKSASRWRWSAGRCSRSRCRSGRAAACDVLTDHYLKAVAFFWLLGTHRHDHRRGCACMAWTLVLCSIPLAATGVQQLPRRATCSRPAFAGFYRIAGYTGGSGLTGNPNDLALMLNLIIPIAGALALHRARHRRALVAAAALLLERRGRRS